MDKKRILIIDDDKNIIRETKDVLELAGFEVAFSEDAEGGLQKIKQYNPDLVLLDLVLPDRSGFKTAQDIRADPHTKDIPIIAISLKHENIDKHVALKSGATEYVEKPIDYDKLLFVIKDILGI